MITQSAALILASGSTIRQQMLKAVGLAFSVMPSGVEEDDLKAANKDISFPELAIILASAKAFAVSKNHPEAVVIGADQLCVHAGHILSKPGTYEKAEAQLAALAGGQHTQHSAVVIARGGEIIWSHHASATLTMRSLTLPEIRAYVAKDAPLTSCGSYKFEAMGRHLFSAVEGEQDVIQGLPLVALLHALHSHGIIAISF